MKLPAALNQFKQSSSEFWDQRNARERRLLMAGSAVLALGVLYALLIGPALAGRDRLNQNLPALRQQVAQLQALSKEAANLSDQSAPAVAPLTRENLQAALQRKGLKPQSVLLTGDLAKVQLSAASFSALLESLDELQKTALVSVVEANIVALAQPDLVDATLTLRQQKNHE